MDIFDTHDLSDLPLELIKELKLAGDIDLVILGLFHEAGGILDLSTLLIGYYRKYKSVKTRQYMMTTCYRLAKKGFLEPTKSKGEYRITDNGIKIVGGSNIEQNNEQEDDPLA
jgi:hypothetical protein